MPSFDVIALCLIAFVAAREILLVMSSHPAPLETPEKAPRG
jgi:hypothetical protein